MVQSMIVVTSREGTETAVAVNEIAAIEATREWYDGRLVSTSTIILRETGREIDCRASLMDVLALLERATAEDG